MDRVLPLQLIIFCSFPIESWACSEDCFNFQVWCVKCIFVQNLIDELGQSVKDCMENFEKNSYEILEGIHNFKLLYIDS